MKNKIFIGGAWPYANNSLHIGHLAALLPADIIARYHRLAGNEVIYVSGTDSHGTPITERARKEGISPKQIAEKYHKEFTQNFNDLSFSYDLYTTTMTEAHKVGVQKFLKEIDKNGYVFEKKEQQDYCEHCKKFLVDREIVGTCCLCGGTSKGDQCDQCLTSLTPEQVKDKKCSICGQPTVQRQNTNLYFKLSAFEKPLLDLVNKNAGRWRANAVKETLGFLKEGLRDRAITRDLNWGIEVPFAGFADKRVYVWFEAVLGYLTAGRAVAEARGISFDEFIKNSQNLKTYYIHAKDNIPFHTMIFPALIMASKQDIQQPDYIVSCDFVNMNNEKMSKSKGNLITVNELLGKYDSDSLRYYIIANGPEKKDINFSLEDYEQQHNKFAVGVLGNFVNRNLAFIAKKFEGKIPNGVVNADIIEKTKEVYTKMGEAIDKGELRLACELMMGYAGTGNKYYDEQKPWDQVKQTDLTNFNNTTYTCVYMMANLANLIEPVMPKTSAKIRDMLGLKNENKWGPANIGKNLKVNNLAVLFNQIIK